MPYLLSLVKLFWGEDPLRFYHLLNCSINGTHKFIWYSKSPLSCQSTISKNNLITSLVILKQKFGYNYPLVQQTTVQALHAKLQVKFCRLGSITITTVYFQGIEENSLFQLSIISQVAVLCFTATRTRKLVYSDSLDNSSLHLSLFLFLHILSSLQFTSLSHY